MDNALSTPITLTEPAPRHGIVGSLARTLVRWLNVWSERRQLRRLDDHMLADIGISREDAIREASRAPWDHQARWV